MRRFILKTFKWSVSILLSKRITVRWRAPFTITLCNLSSKQIPLPFSPDISLRSENIESRISCNWPAICLVSWERSTVHSNSFKKSTSNKHDQQYHAVSTVWSGTRHQEASTSLDPAWTNTIGMHPYVTERQMTAIKQHLLRFDWTHSFLDFMSELQGVSRTHACCQI